jgi:hypothetical protein
VVWTGTDRNGNYLTSSCKPRPITASSVHHHLIALSWHTLEVPHVPRIPSSHVRWRTCLTVSCPLLAARRFSLFNRYSVNSFFNGLGKDIRSVKYNQYEAN